MARLMTISNTMKFNTETDELFIKGVDEPIILEDAGEAAVAGAEEYINILEWKNTQDKQG